jgi:hypothetical protein
MLNKNDVLGEERLMNYLLPALGRKALVNI